MYPNSFDYLAPGSLDEALATLAERGDEVKILAGGQSLIPMMKLRLANPTTLMDINRIPGLSTIAESNGHLTLGALVRHNDVVRSEMANESNKTVAAAAPWSPTRSSGISARSVDHRPIMTLKATGHR